MIPSYLLHSALRPLFIQGILALIAVSLACSAKRPLRPLRPNRRPPQSLQRLSPIQLARLRRQHPSLLPPNRRKTN